MLGIQRHDSIKQVPELSIPNPLGSKMRSAQKSQPKRSNLGDINYASPNMQQGVNGANATTINEAFSDDSEGDEYDDDGDHDPQNPFAHPPRMPPYDFAKRKLSQLIGRIPSPL